MMLKLKTTTYKQKIWHRHLFDQNPGQSRQRENEKKDIHVALSRIQTDMTFTDTDRSLTQGVRLKEKESWNRAKNMRFTSKKQGRVSDWPNSYLQYALRT